MIKYLLRLTTIDLLILVYGIPTLVFASTKISNVSNYQVPMGKRLYILNLFGGYSSLYIDGIFTASNGTNYSTLVNPLIVNEGQNVTGAFDPQFNGFLVNKDFFNDCSKESNFGNYVKDTLSYFNNQTRFVESMNDEFLLITDLQTCSLLNPFVQIFNDTISSESSSNPSSFAFTIIFVNVEIIKTDLPVMLNI